MNKVADGIGSKFGRMISSVVAFFAGYAIGFAYIWELTLVMLAMFPLLVFVGGIMAQVGYLALEERGREGGSMEGEEGRRSIKITKSPCNAFKE